MYNMPFCEVFVKFIWPLFKQSDLWKPKENDLTCTRFELNMTISLKKQHGWMDEDTDTVSPLCFISCMVCKEITETRCQSWWQRLSQIQYSCFKLFCVSKNLPRDFSFYVPFKYSQPMSFYVQHITYILKYIFNYTEYGIA